MTHWRLLSVTVPAIACITGCAVHSDLSAISSKNINLDEMRVDRAKSKGHVTGQDCTHIIAIFPTGGAPILEEAVDRAVESAGANLLTDVSVDYHWFYLPLIYGQYCWTVAGDAHDTFK